MNLRPFHFLKYNFGSNPIAYVHKWPKKAVSSSVFKTYSKLVGFGLSFVNSAFIWAETIKPAKSNRLRNAKAPFCRYLVIKGSNMKKISVVNTVVLTNILRPKPTGNILTKGAKMNSAGIPRNTKRNAFGCFCFI